MATVDDLDDKVDRLIERIDKLIKSKDPRDPELQQLQLKRDKLASQRDARKMEKELDELEHPHKHSWWKGETEKYEEKSKYYKAKHEYAEVHKTDWSLRIILFFALIGGACFLVSGGDGNSQAFDSALYQAEAGLQQVLELAVIVAVCAAILYILFNTVRSPGKKSGDNKGSHH